MIYLISIVAILLVGGLVWWADLQEKRKKLLLKVVDTVRIDQEWISRHKDPFDRVRVRILEIQEGYVQYQTMKGNNYSVLLVEFVKLYRPVAPTELQKRLYSELGI